MKSGMESPKDFGTKLVMSDAVGRKRMAAPCALGRQHLPVSTQQQPHTMQLIPLSALLISSTELCRSKARISSWSFPAAPTGACGHEVQVLQSVFIQSAPHSPSQLQCCCTNQFLPLAAGPRFLIMAGILSEASP